jgi:processive 1,2-diacylglycerol beta-glucosyltransferase
MAIVSPVPGQEERNRDHLLEEGVAIKCNDLVTLPYKVDQLLDHPTRLTNYLADKDAERSFNKVSNQQRKLGSVR